MGTSDDQKRFTISAPSAYQGAIDISEEMPPTNPIRLSPAPDFSVFLCEVSKSPEEAVSLAKTTLAEAVADLHTLTKDSYEDSTFIVQAARQADTERGGGRQPQGSGGKALEEPQS